MRVPTRCKVCLGWGQQAVCRACLDRFAPQVARCPRCALATANGWRCGQCRLTLPALSHAVAVADYGVPWDRLIAQFNFKQQAELAGPLVALLAAAVAETQTRR